MDVEMKKICLRCYLLYGERRKTHLTNEQLSDLYKECLEVARELDNMPTQIITYVALGSLNYKRGRLIEAIKYFEMNLSIKKQTRNTALEGNAHGNLGVCYYSLEQYDKAIDHHEIHLNIAKQIGDKAGEGRASGNLGLCHRVLGEYDKAIHHHEKCLNIAKQIGDKANEGNTYGNLGACYHSLGQYDKAIHHHELQLSIKNQTGDKAGEGSAYGNLGNCYYSLAQYKKAIHYYEMCLNMAEQIRNKANEGRAYGNLGNCYHSLGQYDKAIHYDEMCLNITKQIGQKLDQGRAYGSLGASYHSLGQYDKAIHYHEMCLNIAKQIGDKASERHAYDSLGNCYHSFGQYNKAIHHHEMCLNIAKQIGDKEGEGCVYGHIGSCYHSLGQYDKAIHYHEMCLNIAKQIGYKAGKGGAYGSLGRCYHSLGQYNKAIHFQEMCLNIAKQIGYMACEGCAHGSLGECYSSLGQYNKAIHCHGKCVNIAKQIGNKNGEGRSYGCLGTCYRSLGQYDKAIHLLVKSLNIAKQIGDRSGEHHAYDSLGNCRYSLGQYDKAIHNYEMCLNIAKQIGDKSCEGYVYGHISNCYHSLGQYDKAIHYQEMCLNIAKQIGDKANEGSAYSNLGNCYSSLQQYDKAEVNLMDSLRCFEELFENTPKQDHFKISIRDRFSKVYRQLTRALLLQEKTKQALVIAERGRARALAELMLTSYSAQCNEVTEARVLDLGDICDVVKAVGTSVLFLSLSFDGIYMWVIQPDGDVKFKRSGIVISIETKKCGFLTDPAVSVEEKLKSLISRALKTQGEGFTANCEDRSLSFLYQEEVMEQAYVTTDEMVALETKMSKANICRSSPATLQRDEINQTTPPASTDKIEHRNIEELQQQQESQPTENPPLRELYHLILEPVRQLVNGSHVVVVADGALSLVPFHALVDENDHYVAESLQVRLVPSLATAKMIIERPQEPQRRASPLIIGDPDTIFAPSLDGAYEEARMIGRLFGVEPFTRKDATKEKFLENVENANLIHIAAHGDMKRGEILLASEPGIDRKTAKKEDYMLMMSDLEKKSLRAKLVVLSCCHSARGKVTAEGVIGIARAFIGAGARAVLVALWAIDDEATLYFMEKFYEHLTRGERAGESLDKAMKGMRGTSKFCDIRCWAPFVLIGDNVSLG